MEQLLKELSLYDLTGYLVPGVVVVWALVYVANATLTHRAKDRIELPTLGFIFVGYIAGHMLQTVATFLEEHVLTRFWNPLFWRPIDELYSAEPAFAANLNDAMKNTFANLAQDHPFILCQTYLRVHGLDGYTDIMTARYAFFKGLTLALLIAFLAFVFEAVWSRRQARLRGRIIIVAALLLIATCLSFARLVRFEHYYVDGVYRTFYVGVLPRSKAGPDSVAH